MGLATAKLVGAHNTAVLVCDVNQKRLDHAIDQLRDLGIPSEATVCDITDRSAVDEAMAQAGRMGEITSVVHTAGLSPSMSTAEAIMRVNAIGTLNVVEAALELATDNFSMVNVASTAGHLPAAMPVPVRTYRLALQDPDRFLARMTSRCNLLPAKLRAGMAYSLSKNFVIWLTRRRASAFGARAARIVSVSPGSIDTEMGRLEEATGAGALARHSALARFGTVDEIASVLAFCAGSHPGYLTGTDILVDGGANATMHFRDMLAMARQL
jgi:NAD(P)-dependent dehydrogenase (short-subunit alcohol dehydrogenase family)